MVNRKRIQNKPERKGRKARLDSDSSDGSQSPPHQRPTTSSHKSPNIRQRAGTTEQDASSSSRRVENTQHPAMPNVHMAHHTGMGPNPQLPNHHWQGVHFQSQPFGAHHPHSSFQWAPPFHPYGLPPHVLGFNMNGPPPPYLYNAPQFEFDMTPQEGPKIEEISSEEAEMIQLQNGDADLEVIPQAIIELPEEETTRFDDPAHHEMPITEVLSDDDDVICLD